jgi:protein-tyrosine phosphatase
LTKAAPGVQVSAMKILFVCLGNICRSPMAEGIMRHMAREAGLEGRVKIDSAGTGSWHVGNPPDARAVQTLRRERGIDIADLRARQVEPEDLARFDFVLAMDRANLRGLERLPASGAAVTRPRLFLDFARGVATREVPDPYYGGDDGFLRVLDLIEAGCAGLVEKVRQG